MNRYVLALVLLVVAGSASATWTAYAEVANLSGNWSTTQGGGGWLYQYFEANGTRINMTQDCTSTTGSNYQCWSRRDGGGVSTSASVYPTGRNVSYQVTYGGDAARMSNLAFRRYIDRVGNFTLNGTLWVNSAYCTGGGGYDGINYTALLNGSTLICSGTLLASCSYAAFNCDIGKNIPAGSYLEFDVGMIANSIGDYGNLSFAIYGVLGNGSAVSLNSPADLTSNKTLTQPFSFTINQNLGTSSIANASLWTNQTAGWSLQQSNTSQVAFETPAEIVSTFAYSGQYTWAIQACFADGTCAFSPNRTLILTAPALLVNAFDETTLSRLFFNITLSNSTNSTTFTNQYWLNKTVGEIPTGAVTVSVKNHSCLTGNPLPRAYALTIGYADVNLSAYLLCDTSNPALVNFYILDATARPLYGVLFEAKKLISGSWETVTSKYSDTTGTVGVYLDQNTLYQINAALTGYLPHQSTITPTESLYTITLYGGNGTVGFQTIFDDLFIEIQPQNSYMYGNLSTASFYLNDSLSQLNYWGWNVSYNGSTLYFINWTANASGGYDAVTLNNVGRTGNYSIAYWFSRGNFSQWTLTREYYINPTNYTNASLSEAIKQPKATGAPNTLFIVLGAVLIPFITRAFTKFTVGGGGIIALCWWALWAYAGFLSWTAYAITAITFFAYKAMTKAY